MYSRAARLVREQKVGKGWQCSTDEKELVGGGEVGFERLGRGRGRKTVGKEKEGGEEGLERRAHSELR